MNLGESTAQDTIMTDLFNGFDLKGLPLSNLVERLRANASLNKPDPATFYGVGPKGYTDYPALEIAAAA